MMRVRHILLFVFLAAGTALNGQYTKEFKRIFFDADYLFETGFYEEAFSRYKNLLTLDPGNCNILFHCGACCLNIQGSEDQAITYLKEATEGVTLSYKDKSHKEPGAPVFTYFLLGQAYHLNYQFASAEENYLKYLEEGTNHGGDQLEYARTQLEACQRASKVERRRPAFEFKSVLEHFDNDLPSCSNPVISGDGNILIFLVDYPSDKKIMMTTRSDSVWSRPRVINSEIGMVGETYPVSMSYDGKDLYVAHQYYSHSDIFVSHLKGSRWSEAEPLGYHINGRTSEDHASISRDGQSLYFTTDIRGGSGSFDIYVSRLEEKGWGEPTNLGPVINTPFEEQTPFISSNDSILFFSSQGHTSMGGLDVFFSHLNSDGSWSTPENMGYPVNSTGDDLFFNPGWEDMEGYYAVRREDDPTSNTINFVLEVEYPEEVALVESTDSVYADLDNFQVSSRPDHSESGGDVSAASTTTTTTAPAMQATTIPVLTMPVPNMPAQTTVSTTDQTTVSDTPATVEEAIEPPNTDEIEDVLNQGRAPEPVPERVSEPVPESTPLTTIASGVPGTAPPAYTNELITSVPFDYNTDQLGMAAMLEAERISDLMKRYPEVCVSLTGHADATGSAEYNMLLSLHRAENIAGYLEKKGVERSRITVDGKGESAPLAKNTYPDGSDAPLGRYLNRQVYVKILGKLPIESGLTGLFIPESLKPAIGESQLAATRDIVYTIQLSAAKNAVPLTRFVGVENVSEYSCSDGFYRYAIGSYNNYQEARENLEEVQAMGYADAFIQTLDWYEKSTK